MQHLQGLRIKKENEGKREEARCLFDSHILRSIVRRPDTEDAPTVLFSRYTVFLYFFVSGRTRERKREWERERVARTRDTKKRCSSLGHDVPLVTGVTRTRRIRSDRSQPPATKRAAPRDQKISKRLLQSSLFGGLLRFYAPIAKGREKKRKKERKETGIGDGIDRVSTIGPRDRDKASSRVSIPATNETL